MSCNHSAALIPILVFIFSAFFPAGCYSPNNSTPEDGGDGYDAADMLLPDEIDIATGPWAKSYSTGTAKAITTTAAGGFLVAGSLFPSGEGSVNILVLKLDAHGGLIWQKVYGGPENDWPNDVQKTSDDGFIVVGKTNSFGVGWGEILILKLDGDGNAVWQKAYGSGGDDAGHAIREIQDGFIVAGNWGDSQSSWVMKIDATGNVIWEKSYGVDGLDCFTSIEPTEDGGYIVAGEINFGMGQYQARVLKLDADGNVIWQKSFAQAGGNLRTVGQISDGSYIVTGPTDFQGVGDNDIWIIKFDPNGNIAWQKLIDGGDADFSNAILQTSEGTTIIGGGIHGLGAGSTDFWILGMDESASILWQRTYGGSEYEGLIGMIKSGDGGLVAVGDTESFDTADGAIWVLKLEQDGGIGSGCPDYLSTSTSAVPVDVTLPEEDDPALVHEAASAVTVTDMVPRDIDITVLSQCE